MTNLTGFYFNPYSLIYLCQWILALAALIYFWHLRDRAHNTRIASIVFLGLVGLTGAEWLRSTAIWERQFVALQLRYVFLFLIAYATLQIIYTFPKIANDPFECQRNRELPLFSGVYAGSLVLVTGFSTFQIYQFYAARNPQFRGRIFDALVMLGCIHLIIVLARRIWQIAQPFRSGPMRWQHLPLAQQTTLKTLVNVFGTLTFVLVITVIANITNYNNLLSPLWREIVPSVGVLFGLTFLLTTFLSTTLQKNSLIVRLVTPVFLTVFVVLGLVSLIGGQNLSAAIQTRPDQFPAGSRFFAPQSDGTLRVRAAAADFNPDWGAEIEPGSYTLPFDFPFQGETWPDVSLTADGVLTLGPWDQTRYAYNRLAAIGIQHPSASYRVFANPDAQPVVFTWQNRAVPAETFQIELYPNGQFALHFSQLPGDTLKRIGFQSGDGSSNFTEFKPDRQSADFVIARGGLLSDYEILSQKAIHRQMIPLAIMVLVFSAASIVGFPLLFRYVLIQPLNDLVAGVRAVESGEMDAQVRIHADDEIGMVAQAFNRMVCAVLETEQNLEDKVEARTRELVESERRLGALEERDRIGRELHDDLGQVMGYVHMQSEAALARLAQDDTVQARQILSDIDQAAQEAHDSVRQYILGIRTGKTQPAPADFWQALEAYLTLMQTRYGLQLQLQAPAELRATMQLDPVVETQVLRIIQEGLTNVYKHAQADQVELRFNLTDDWLTILLRDDGRGFEGAAGLKDGTHFGLQIMHERAEGVNGQLEVQSAPGAGTQLQIRVPCRLSARGGSDEPGYLWRVLLVDDHALFREGLSNMLRPHGIQIVGVADNGVAAETLATELQPDLILMDIHMPQRDGLEATRRIKSQFPQIKIVMLTVAAEEELLLQALRNGAAGYLLKNLPAPQFLSLLSDVMAGKIIVSPNLATQALTTLAQQESAAWAGSTPKLAALTDRQTEVLRCLGAGMSNRQIAEELFISENTVKYHVGQIMSRLGLQTRFELIRYQLDQES